MHILHISSPKSWRGGEQQIAYLLEELRLKGIKQTILCPYDSEMRVYLELNNFSFHPFKKIFSLNPLVAKKIKNICLKEKVDIIHVHDSHAHSFAWMAASFLKNKTPIVISRRVDFAIKKKRTTLWKYNHPNVKSIICVSRAVKEIASPAIKNKSLLKIVYDGIDLKRFSLESSKVLRKEYNISKEKYLIGNVAAIAPHKDLFTFVNTVEILIKEKLSAHFFIIGSDGGEQEKIETYIREKGLEKNITLTSFRNDISRILPELDVFLFTSKTEGLGTSVLDALAAGVPVVTTQAGGIPEYIVDEKNGMSVSVQNSKGLAEKIITLLGNEEIRKKMIEEGRKTVLNFSKEVMAEKTLDIYEAIINEKYSNTICNPT